MYEVRKVSASWDHPKNEDGSYHPFPPVEELFEAPAEFMYYVGYFSWNERRENK